MPNSIAAWLITGKLPGWPEHTGQIWVLVSAPKALAHEQNILLLVKSWAWTSNPITDSN
jgi:hypothetical protein